MFIFDGLDDEDEVLQIIDPIQEGLTLFRGSIASFLGWAEPGERELGPFGIAGWNVGNRAGRWCFVVGLWPVALAHV